jgi:hypothetical protein
MKTSYQHALRQDPDCLFAFESGEVHQGEESETTFMQTSDVRTGKMTTEKAEQSVSNSRSH